MELWVNEFWLLGTAVIFTGIGYFWGYKKNVVNLIELTIDGLIAEGYLLTVTDENGEVTLLKHEE
jgi:hypothetical protein